MNEQQPPEWDRLDVGESEREITPGSDLELEASGAVDHQYELGDPQSEVTTLDNDSPRRGAKPVLGWIVALGLILAAFGAWWWLRQGPEVPPEELGSSTQPSAVELPAESAESEMAPEVDDFVVSLPELSASDELVRRTVAELSSHPRLAELLATDSLIDRVVRVVANVAYGEDPRVHLKFAGPADTFEGIAADGEGPGLFVMTEASKKRFDSAVAVFASLDTEGTVKAFRRLEPLLEESYEQLGLPGTFEQALRRAARTLQATPDVQDPLLRRGKALSFRFDDPRLEELGQGQKLLLRMGRQNRQRVLAKVRQIERALETT